MDGYIKLPKNIFELGLSPNEFVVLANLIRVKDYREFKGEVKDGWFVKSQNELAKECGFKSRKTLTKVLNTMVKNAIVNYTIVKTDTTKFKISMVNDTIVKNTIANNTTDTMVNDTTGAMVNFTTLHKNSKKNKPQEYTPNNFTPVEVPVNSNNNPVEQNMEIEEKKEIKEQNTIEQNKVTSNSSKRDYYIGCFEEGIGKGETPTFEQIAGFVLKNDISFTKEDFKINVYDTSCQKVEGKYLVEPVNLGRSAMTKLIPLKTEFGYIVSSDTQTIQDFMIRYVNKHQDLNIIVK